MAKALVTGATGFVGAHVVRALLDAGHEARALKRATSAMTALEDVTGYEPVVGDVLDPASLAAAMAGCDWVFHVAAVSDYWRQSTDWMYEVNVIGTRNVLRAARQVGVKRVVFTSSAAAIGTRADGFPADESVTFNQPSAAFPYAHSKFLAEIEVLKAVIAGLDCVTLNPAVVIGPGDVYQGSGSLLIELKKGTVPGIPPGGVTLIDVRDVARAHVAAAERGRVAERYILGAVDLSYKAWLALAADVLGVAPPRLLLPRFAMPVMGAGVDLLRALKVPIPADGNQVRLSGRRLYFNYQQAWAELGEPQVDIRQSLRDTAAWFEAHGML
ncbi:MAG: NAD-dependent epimerase/dehydratase family protein [Anaerolineae bacterium]|nr:NAD-dependent epimerase/dehydratase family protein [Anaerolineae bacterium]